MNSIEKKQLTQQRIKSIHLKQIYLLALKNKNTSRQQIGQTLQLSPPAASALVDELLARGVLTEWGVSEIAGRGRPSVMLQVLPTRFVIPVISLTKDGFDAFLFDTAANVLEQVHLTIDLSTAVCIDGLLNITPCAFSQPILDWIDTIRARYTPLVLIASLYGNISNGFFSSSAFNFKVPAQFLSYLEQRTELSVILGNNASYYAYGEKRFHPDESDFIYLFVDDGVGAGILHNGEIFGKGLMQAGEFGHISIDYNGLPCTCGGRGCMEQYISIPSIARDSAMPFTQLCSAFQSGDEYAVRLITAKAAQLAVGISNMLTMHPTEHIIIGGRIVSLGDSFLEILSRQIHMVGMRGRMAHVRVNYSSCSNYGDVFGALWNYLEQTLEIEDISEFKK